MTDQLDALTDRLHLIALRNAVARAIDTLKRGQTKAGIDLLEIALADSFDKPEEAA